ncbi:ty3-gypsy retrotransposon protein [Tanacetum coccineum]
MRMAATYQKELFAIVEAIYKWRQYLIGRRFIIRTDHKSMKDLMFADALLRMYEDEENVIASFMAMSEPRVGLFPDLKHENESLDELLSLHQKMDRLPVSKGLTTILVMVDRFLKYAHFGALPTSFNAHKVVEGEGMGRHPYSVPGFCLGGKDGVWGGTENEVVSGLPEEIQGGQPVEQPLAICDSCLVLKN